MIIGKRTTDEQEKHLELVGAGIRNVADWAVRVAEVVLLAAAFRAAAVTGGHWTLHAFSIVLIIAGVLHVLSGPAVIFFWIMSNLPSKSRRLATALTAGLLILFGWVALWTGVETYRAINTLISTQISG